MNGTIAYALSKQYVADTADSLGSLKGAPCTIKSITEVDSGQKVTFEWTGTSSTKQTSEMTVKNGVSVTGVSDKGNGVFTLLFSDDSESDPIQTIKGQKGDKGDKLTFNDLTDEEKASLKGSDGVSPTITENAGNTDKIYRLDITTADSTFTTPNLKGADGQGGTGGSGEENKIDSISVNGVNVEIDENKNVDITVPSIEGLTKDADLATVAKSGDYDDLANKPEIPSVEGLAKTTDIPTKVSELENDSNYLSSIPEEYVTDTELEAKGYLTEHQDISGKVDKVEGKSLIADTEIERLASVDNYDDSQVKTQIQAVANGLMDSVGYSADYKSIDIIAKNNEKKSVDVAPIISHASITELSDVDTTNKATGKALVYNATTSKHEYADVSGTDEKVKMDASTDAKYLGELLDNVTIANENGELKVKKLDGQEVTITEINYLKGLTMNVMDLVNMFSNGGVKIINTPVATYAELLTLDKSSFIEGISYLVYVLADENHDNAKTTYLVDKDSETPTYFGFADSQRDFTTNPIDLATEITGKLGISNMDSDAIKALFTVDDTYKTETTTNNAFSTHGAKALYDELLLAIGNKANNSDLTNHKDDTDIHVSTAEKDNWNSKANASDLTAHTDDADIHVTAENKATWNTVSDKVDKEDGKGLSANDYTNEEKALVGTIEDKINKNSIATALDDTATDEQVASALLTKTELDKKINKTSIVTELSDASTDDEVFGALTAYNELQKLESSNKEQFSTASGDYITVNDSVDGNIVELGVNGNSFQQTYRGVNLLNYNWIPTNTKYGVTITNNGDNSWTFSGSIADNTKAFELSGTRFTKDTAPKEFHKAGYYTMSVKGITLADDNQYAYVTFYYNGKTYYNSLKNSTTVRITEEMLAYDDFHVLTIGFYIAAGSTLKTGTVSVQIEYSETATEFEPYVGGIPAPNPLYPQVINSVGDDGSLVIKSCGKNLIPYPYFDSSDIKVGITATVNVDSSITLKGTATSDYFFILLNRNDNGKGFAKKLRGKTVTISGGTSSPVLSFAVYDEDGNNVTPPNNEMLYDYGSGVTVTIPDNACDMYSYYYFSSGNAVDVTLRPQLEVSNVVTGYEPYKESTATIQLSEPLRAIGDVKDEITYQDGKWGVLRRIKKLVADTPTKINPSGALIGTTYDILANFEFEAQDSYNVVNKISDMSKHIFLNFQSINIWNKDECGAFISWSGSTDARLSSSICGSTLDEVKAYFKNNPLIGQYVLATPVFEPFADQTLPYLSTYDGVTNISNDDALSAEITVKYPTTDASGVGSRNESRIADIESAVGSTDISSIGDGTITGAISIVNSNLDGLTFSASGTTLSITDGTNTWTLEANS